MTTTVLLPLMIGAFALAVGLAFWFGHRSGRLHEQNDAARQKSRNHARVRRARDRLHADTEFADRVRARFRR